MLDAKQAEQLAQGHVSAESEFIYCDEPPRALSSQARHPSCLQAGNDLRHVEPEFELQAHVLALLPGQTAAHLDANVLRLQDAHDLGQRRAYGLSPVAGFALARAEERFNVHGISKKLVRGVASWRRAGKVDSDPTISGGTSG